MLGQPLMLLLVPGFCLAAFPDSQVKKDEELTSGQQLVIAAFQLDVDRVQALLANGADPNSKLGFYDKHLFEDKWTLGYSHLGSENWTPLLAVANSHRASQPDKPAENTVAGLDAARGRLKAVDPKLITERDRRRITIAKLLIAAKANLDLDDGYGATALSASKYSRFDELALLLISSNAKVNTKTGIYIDGSGDITPLHRATGSPKVLQAMIQRGADVNVADTSGNTPLHWAVRDINVESVKLLLEAGADVAATDDEGRIPAYWCRTFEGIEIPGDKEKKEIFKLFEDAKKNQKVSKQQ